MGNACTVPRSDVSKIHLESWLKAISRIHPRFNPRCNVYNKRGDSKGKSSGNVSDDAAPAVALFLLDVAVRLEESCARCCC